MIKRASLLNYILQTRPESQSASLSYSRVMPPWLSQTQSIIFPGIKWGITVGSGGRPVERRIVNRAVGCSIPAAAVSKLTQFRSPHICMCISEETGSSR